MESMANCCWCGDCRSFEILDGIHFLDLVSLGVNNFVNKCLCVFSSFIFFHLVNFASGTLFLVKAHSHKIRRVIFQSTTNYYFKNCTIQKLMSTFLFFFVGSKEFWAITTMTFNPFISHKRQRKKAHAIIKNWRNFLWRMPKPILLRMRTSLYDVHKVNSWVAKNHPQESHLS